MIETQQTYGQLHIQHFFETIIFTYQWWLLLVVSIGLWVIWALLVDKRRLNAILLVGLLVSLMALAFDEIGILLALWAYDYYLVPFTSKLYPVDLAIVPVFFMLLYQYVRAWKPYLLVLTLLTLFAVIVAEPLFVALDIYILLVWEHWYSAPIYILMGIFVKWLVDKVVGEKR
ncbi:CBO0543 family protein [Virgibacillus natechei]|nr:CBO0543 family protein [Virgibacillus natechei]